MAKKNQNIMVQIATYDNESDAIKYIQGIGVSQYVILQEAKNILQFFMFEDERVKQYQNTVSMTCKAEDWRNNHDTNYFGYIERVKQKKNENYLLICMVGKTGDTTLNRTFDKHEIPYVNMMHKTELFSSEYFLDGRTIKVLNAVRDPFSQMLSAMYEFIGKVGLEFCYQTFYRFIPVNMEESMTHHGGDVQYIFEQYIERPLILAQKSGIQNFLQRFSDNIVDIQNTPFDKEKGYGIAKKGNIEVFTYQLEKMNDLVKELADFVGTPFDAWEMGNVAADKWIANSYKQAKKEIKISKEFFEMSYNEPWVSHFYSEADIEKFKAKWRPHIKEEQ